MTRFSFARCRAALATLSLAALLTGCGGVYLGYEYSDDDYGDAPPAVSMVSSTNVARVGDVVRLVAAASDDYAIDHVDFFSVDAQGVGTLITALRFAPYNVDVIMPSAPGGVVYFMARAVDDVGQFADSPVVAVTVVP